jgi:hypothetical protein
MEKRWKKENKTTENEYACYGNAFSIIFLMQGIFFALPLQPKNS